MGLGLGPFWHGCQGRETKGLEASCLALVEVAERAACAVSMRQCQLAAAEQDAHPPLRSGILQAVAQSRAAMAVKRHAVHHFVADGAYSTTVFVQGFCALGLQAVCPAMPMRGFLAWDLAAGVLLCSTDLALAPPQSSAATRPRFSLNSGFRRAHNNWDCPLGRPVLRPGCTPISMS